MKHRITSLLLAVLLIASLLPGGAFAAGTGKVRVIVENTALREERYQGFQVPWWDLQFDLEVDHKSGMTADSALKAAAKEYLMGLISVDDYLTYDDGALTGVGGLLDWGKGEWLVAVNDWITTLSERVQPGDTVRVMYTVSRGKDVGADPASTDKGLRALTFDCGALYPTFSPDVASYTLYVPASFRSVTVLPTAANRRLKVFVTAGNEDASRWGARSVPVSSGTVTVKVDGGKAYTVKLVPFAEATPTAPPTPTPTAKPCDGGASCPSRAFVDVDHGSDSWYHLAVDWAVTAGVTNGLDAAHFGPNASCTRGQMVTFLWRAKGSPEPTRTSNPFVDVPGDQYYYKPVLWAVENGITNGMDAKHFGPDSTVTRGQTVTFLWRLEGQPAPKGTGGFTDVAASEYYAKAVAWAVENGITNGVGDGKFAPDNHCTRAQIVTFLWRDLTGGEQALALSAADDADPLTRMMEKTPAPKCGQDDLVVFDAARNAAAEGRTLPDGYWAYLSDVKATSADVKALAGTVLAVTALGYNAADLGGQDLTARLCDRKFVTASGTEGQIWALLALDSGSYASYLRPDLVQAILAAQGEDGSIEGSIPRTAMALQALAPYLAESGVLRAVNSALRYLSAQQQTNGGFASGDPDATAEALLASEMLTAQRVNLTTAQIVPGFFSKENGTLQTHLESFLRPDGSYPTETALRAAIAEQCKALGVMIYIVR